MVSNSKIKHFLGVKPKMFVCASCFSFRWVFLSPKPKFCLENIGDFDQISGKIWLFLAKFSGKSRDFWKILKNPYLWQPCKLFWFFGCDKLFQIFEQEFVMMSTYNTKIQSVCANEAFLQFL